MTLLILDGKKVAKDIETDLPIRIKQIGGREPRLVALLTTDNPASKIYIGRKRKFCNRVGVDFELHHPDPKRLLNAIDALNSRADVDGIMVQLPLAEGIDRHRVFDAIDPRKDVDCFSPTNVGLVVQGRPRFLPPTPHAVHQLLVRHGIMLDGKKVCIINRSDIVGKPLQAMLVQDQGEEANATVVLCHDRTPRRRLLDACWHADIIVVAVGIPNFVTVGMIREGAVIVDVGINRLEDGRVVGDVDYDKVAPFCSAISPVPGGVGLVTVANLIKNTVDAFELNKPVWSKFCATIHSPDET